MSYQELRREIKALRVQMAGLQDACNKREDRMFRIIEMMKPFFDAMTEQEQKEFMQRIEGIGDE